MAFYKSRNPALSEDLFKKASLSIDSSETMSIEGTVNKTSLLALIVFACALITWKMFYTEMDSSVLYPYILGGAITGFILSLIIIFKNTTAPYLAPVYCAMEGLFLGGISALMDFRFPGIVIQAILLTFGILFSLLIIYRMQLIAVTENFKMIVASATAGIAVFYLIAMIAGFFGFNIALLHEGSVIGIVFSLFVVVIASLNLVVDFDFIEKGAEAKAPKYMEWYAAFGLMITIIWLYLEILRLLSKLSSRR